MNEKDQRLAQWMSRRGIENSLNLKASHYAETVALNKQEEAGSEKDKMAEDRH